MPPAQNFQQKAMELLKLDLDLTQEHDRFRLAVSGVNWALGRLLKRESRKRGDMEWALWRIPVLRRSETLPNRGRVLWIPGWGDSPSSWLGVLVAAFAGTGFEEVVVLDFPGFHGSLAHRRCITEMDRILEVARDTLQELRPEVLGGHSLGGWLAAWAVLHADSRTPSPDRLILMAPSGVTGGEQDREIWRHEFKSWRESTPEEYVSKLFGRIPPQLTNLVKGFAESLIPFMRREDTVEFLNSVKEHHFLEKKLEKVSSNVSLLWGGRDGVVPERFATHWVSKLPSVRYERWKEVGHMPHLEAPVRLARWIRSAALQ
ncbi:MAG: alpha/beta fold hydrolase [Oligoflexia bacterium]